MDRGRPLLGGEAAIGVRAGMISLFPGGEVTVDVEQFERSPSTELYRGDLLPEDRYAEWTEPRRERARQRYLDLLRSAGNWEGVLEVDRADEPAHRAFMEAYLDSGNRAAAIRQFERLPWVVYLSLSPDGRSLAGGGSDNTVHVWDTGTGQELLALDRPGTQVAFSPEGRWLAIVSGEGVKVWDAGVPCGKPARAAVGAEP